MSSFACALQTSCSRIRGLCFCFFVLNAVFQRSLKGTLSPQEKLARDESDAHADRDARLLLSEEGSFNLDLPTSLVLGKKAPSRQRKKSYSGLQIPLDNVNISHCLYLRKACIKHKFERTVAWPAFHFSNLAPLQFIHSKATTTQLQISPPNFFWRRQT